MMTYEEYLDEIATLLTEIYTMSDADAIATVMRAQDDSFFCAHDDDAQLRTLERAQADARIVFKTYKPARGERRGR